MDILLFMISILEPNGWCPPQSKPAEQHFACPLRFTTMKVLRKGQWVEEIDTSLSAYYVPAMDCVKSICVIREGGNQLGSGEWPMPWKR